MNEISDGSQFRFHSDKLCSLIYWWRDIYMKSENMKVFLHFVKILAISKTFQVKVV